MAGDNSSDKNVGAPVTGAPQESDPAPQIVQESSTPLAAEPSGEAPTASVRVRGPEDPATEAGVDSASRNVSGNTEALSGFPAGAGAADQVADQVPTTTALLSIRPPEEEVRRRSQIRDKAPERHYVGARILQVLLAIFTPYLLLVGAIRLIASPIFLAIEYFRPGFPADSVFPTHERLTTASYALDYLFNAAGTQYLGSLLNGNDQHIFIPAEVSHMRDVKMVFLVVSLIAVVLLIASVIFMVILARTYKGGIRRGLFAGAILTILVVLALGVLGSIGWESFFTTFHEIFFSQGNWEFSASDSLIRLFPSQFWIDASASIAVLVLIAAILILVFTWPTNARRSYSLASQEFLEEYRTSRNLERSAKRKNRKNSGD